MNYGTHHGLTLTSHYSTETFTDERPWNQPAVLRYKDAEAENWYTMNLPLTVHEANDIAHGLANEGWTVQVLALQTTFRPNK